MKWTDFNSSSYDCRKNYSYFGSADYLRNAYQITALFTIPLSAFTFYVIFRVTPKRMKNMKIPLLIAHAWSTNLDLIFTVYSGPMIFFPTASGVPLGILGAFGVGVKWQSYWGQVSVTMIGVCFIMLYENRQSQISTITFKIKSTRVRVLYFAANYMFAFVVMLPFYLDDTDQVEMRKFVLKVVPCPVIEFWDPKTYVLLKGGEVIPSVSISTGMGFVIIQTFFFLIHTVYHLTMVSNASVSVATKKLQQKFLGYVSIQISIPWIAIAFPVGYSMFAYEYGYYNQAYNNNAMLIMANHGLLVTICTLFIYKPYRDFIKQITTGYDDQRRVSRTVGVANSRIGSISGG